MIGYKIFKRNCKEDGIDQWVGVTHTIEGEVEPFVNGYKFCLQLPKVFSIYSTKRNRSMDLVIYEVEASGNIIRDNMVYSEPLYYFSQSIKLIREITIEELVERWGDDKHVMYMAACRGYRLDLAIDSECEYVRVEVASQGYGLDRLVNDDSWYVRLVVANHSEWWDILQDDETKIVRDRVEYLRNNREKWLEGNGDSLSYGIINMVPLRE